MCVTEVTPDAWLCLAKTLLNTIPSSSTHRLGIISVSLIYFACSDRVLASTVCDDFRQERQQNRQAPRCLPSGQFVFVSRRRTTLLYERNNDRAVFGRQVCSCALFLSRGLVVRKLRSFLVFRTSCVGFVCGVQIVRRSCLSQSLDDRQSA